MKKYILFDHDDVLVDTEFWYHKAGERALADIGFTLDKDQYLRDMNQSLGTWAQARAAGIDEQTIDRQREVRNVYYQEYLRTEAIEIEGVVETLAELSKYVRMAIVTTAKRVDFEIIHEKRQIRQFMDFILVREDYKLSKPHQEPYLTGLKNSGATAATATGITTTVHAHHITDVAANTGLKLTARINKTQRTRFFYRHPSAMTRSNPPTQ